MEKVILIDSDSLLYKNIEDYDAYTDRIDEILSEAISKSNADFYKVFIEHPNNTTFRKIINKTYKSNRKGKPLPFNYNEIKQYIIETYNPYVAVGAESDDYIVSTLNYINKEYPLTNVIVCANDKDYLTYPLDYMDLYYGRYLETKSVNNKEAKFNFYLQMLMGDGADGVKCLSGVGIKTASNMIRKCKTDLDYMKVIWAEYRSRHKSKWLAKKAIQQNYLMLKLRDDLKPCKNFDKVEFE